MRLIISLLALSLLTGPLAQTHADDAPDNTLTAAEKKAGWQLLFNGKNLEGWICNNGKEIATEVEDGAIVPLYLTCDCILSRFLVRRRKSP
jgi:hypothetical protein